MAGTEPVKEHIRVAPGEVFNHYWSVKEPFEDAANTDVTLEVYERVSNWTETLAVFPASLVEEGGAQFNVAADDWADIPNWSRFRVWIDLPDIGRVRWIEGSIVKD